MAKPLSRIVHSINYIVKLRGTCLEGCLWFAGNIFRRSKNEMPALTYIGTILTFITHLVKIFHMSSTKSCFSLKKALAAEKMRFADISAIEANVSGNFRDCPEQD